jgi:hypothetical protein
MDHPESLERVQHMSGKLKNLNIALERKYSLHLLRTSLKREGKRAGLLIDGAVVWEGVNDESTACLLERVRKILDRDFQMELAPYDLRLEEEGGALWLKNALLARTPLPGGMWELPTLRQNLLGALARAKQKHPMAKYFQ